MPLDKFGRSDRSSKNITAKRGLPGEGFKLTAAGDFNIDNKRLKFVADPEEPGDVVNKHYFDTIRSRDSDKLQVAVNTLPDLINSKIAPLRQSFNALSNDQEQIKSSLVTPLQQSLTELNTKLKNLSITTDKFKRDLESKQKEHNNNVIAPIQQSLAALIPKVQSLSTFDKFKTDIKPYKKLLDDSHTKIQEINLELSKINSIIYDNFNNIVAKLKALAEFLPEKAKILKKWEDIEPPPLQFDRRR